jgi:hypothetical protein
MAVSQFPKDARIVSSKKNHASLTASTDAQTHMQKLFQVLMTDGSVIPIKNKSYTGYAPSCHYILRNKLFVIFEK